MANENHYGDPEVANIWDKGPEPTDQLPNAELNPLLNPTLGRNLGRWAHVYFTNPPEKREAAVGELLRELENENPGIAAPKDRRVEEPASGAKLQPEVLCPGCQHKNAPNQRFCGHCGSPLRADSASGAYRSGEAFAEGHTPVPIAPNHPGSDVQWLRDKAAIGLEELEAPTHSRWKYLIVGLVILLAGFAYLQWAAWPHGAPTSPPSAAVPVRPMPQSQPQAAEPRGPAPPAGKTWPAQAAVMTGGNISEGPAKTSFAPPAQKLSAAGDVLSVPPPQAGAEGGGGAQELLLAQRYLEGKNGPRDTSAAANLLWKAVAKRNTSAALMLADLYTRGDGVPRSCDQARLLLVAAVKQGSALAAQRLRSLESNSCQ